MLNPQDQPGPNENQIVIDDVDIDRLIQQFKTTWQRSPTLEEMTALQEGLLREEILVREARSLGLDLGDSVIRGRLAQKMDFLTLSLAQSTEPDDAVLQEHLDNFSERFMRSGAIAFQQIGFGPEPDPKIMETALTALNAGTPPDELGKPSGLNHLNYGVE